MKTKLVPLLGIAFVVALISTGIFYGLIAGKLRSASNSAAAPVVVANHSLSRGAVIQAADLRLEPMHEAPKGSFSALDQAVGFTVLEPIAENGPVTDERVATHKAIPTGMRAISIHVTDSSGIVGMLHPGYKVDVQVVSQVGNNPMLRTVLQDIEVLAVVGAEGTRPVVNLLVSPEQSDLLGLADSSARVRLALRNPRDDGRPDQATVQFESLYRAAKAPAKTPVKIVSKVAPLSAGAK